jgi:two-component system, OmpR family, response regulator
MRVLVVDDEKRLARSLRVGLEAEGFAVDVANDGTDGLWLARENQYDAIVLDLMLPGINGYKVCETLRAERDWTPILMLTAKDGEWDQVEGLDTGADDYLTKPFSFPVLVARLRAVARRGARERPTQLEVGDIRVDPAARRVWRGDAEVELTAREYSLLAFLARHQGDVLSKPQILEAVWDIDFEGDPNIVEVYIRHLRNKLDRRSDARRSRRCAVRAIGWRATVAEARWSRASVRVRTTVAAVLVVAIVLLISHHPCDAGPSIPARRAGDHGRGARHGADAADRDVGAA